MPGPTPEPTSEPTVASEPEPEPPTDTSPTPPPEPAAAPSQAEPTEEPRITRMLGMLTALFNALRAPVETVQMIYDTLAEYWDRIAEIMEYSDEKEGAQARCLIGFSQVGRFP